MNEEEVTACDLDDAEEWNAAAADMKAREGAWEDNGCRPMDGYEEIV